MHAEPPLEDLLEAATRSHIQPFFTHLKTYAVDSDSEDDGSGSDTTTRSLSQEFIFALFAWLAIRRAWAIFEDKPLGQKKTFRLKVTDAAPLSETEAMESEWEWIYQAAADIWCYQER